MAVAGRYVPQQSLIGPTLFPIYRVIIRSLILYFLLPWFLLWLGVTIFSPDFRADHRGAALFASLKPWWLACAYSLFFNTLAFALLDRSQARLHLVNDWNPRSLPAVRDRNVVSRGGTIFELTVVVATWEAPISSTPSTAYSTSSEPPSRCHLNGRIFSGHRRWSAWPASPSPV